MKARCRNCKKWAEGFDVIKILFGFYVSRHNENKKWISPRPFCRDCQRLLLDEMKAGKFKELYKGEKIQTVELKVFNILDGLTQEQKNVVTFLVQKGFHPLGFTVYVKENKIFYFGKEVGVEV